MTKEQTFGKWLSLALFGLTGIILIWVVWQQTYPPNSCELIWSNEVKPFQSIKQSRFDFIKACNGAEFINLCRDGYVEAGSNAQNCTQHGGIQSIIKQPDG